MNAVNERSHSIGPNGSMKNRIREKSGTNTKLGILAGPNV
jgi:hypothetical protein